MGEGNKKLSKRDPQAHLLAYRDQGFLPEGLLNYLALLGWAIAADRDVFTLEEMVEAFDIRDVNPNPARFDLKKAGGHQRRPHAAAHRSRRSPSGCCRSSSAPASSATRSPTDAQLLDLAMPLVAERINKLTEAADMLGFLFVDEDALQRDPTTSRSCSTRRPRRRNAASRRPGGLHPGRPPPSRRRSRPRWSRSSGSSRASPSARSGSPYRQPDLPPLFESMELLGRERSLAGRLAAPG